jgi:hypothetical protein
MGVERESTVDQTLIRGLATAFRVFVSGLASVELARADKGFRSIGRGLGLGEVRKAIVADAAQFAVEIGSLRPHFRERRKQAWILGYRLSSPSLLKRPHQGRSGFMRLGTPVDAGARQKLCLSAFNPHSHAESVELTAEGATWTAWWTGSDRCALKSIWTLNVDRCRRICTV